MTCTQRWPQRRVVVSLGGPIGAVQVDSRVQGREGAAVENEGLEAKGTYFLNTVSLIWFTTE